MPPRAQYPGPPVYADVPICRDDELDVPREPIVLASPPAPEPACDEPERVVHKGDISTLRLQAAPPEPILKNERGLYLFSRWGDVDEQGVPERETPPFEGSYLFLSSPLSEIPRTWYIELWAYEIARIIQGDPVPPLGQGNLGKNGGQMSRLKIAIEYHRSSSGTVRVVDLAEGIRMAVMAERVSVHILYPKPGVFGLGDIAERTELDGLVLDTLVGGFIADSFSPPGQQLATNTFTVRVPAASSDVPHDVPPGARSVTLWQAPEGAVATPEWRLLRANTPPLPGPSLGTITIGATRRAERMDRPGNAGMVTSGPADSVDRFLTFVWNLEV